MRCQGDSRQTKNDKIDSKKIAVLLRGGTLPMAYVDPEGMRSTRICSGGEITWSIVIDQMIKRIFEVSGGDLFLEVDGDELALRMGIRLVSGHGYSLWDGLK